MYSSVTTKLDEEDTTKSFQFSPSPISSSKCTAMLKPAAPNRNLLRRWLSRLRLSSSSLNRNQNSKSNTKNKKKKKLTKSNSFAAGTGVVHPNSSLHNNNNNDDENFDQDNPPQPSSIIRIATFNASLFSMAAAVPDENQVMMKRRNVRSCSGPLGLPKSILKQSPLHPNATGSNHHQPQVELPKSRLRVSINLPDNEISLGTSRRIAAFISENERKEGNTTTTTHKLVKSRTMVDYNHRRVDGGCDQDMMVSDRTVVDVLRELDLDILALQEVKADEEKEMKPLSALASALGMNYVFGDSWAPEYGNAILSRWPIKHCRVQKIVDDSDFRNVLKTTIEVPKFGEVNVYCTELDRLDEEWRMKQIHSIIDDNAGAPHILLGGLNSLDQTDYSKQRWNDILNYYEDIGKPTPKTEVMKYLKCNRNYIDAKDFVGDGESVVVIAKGQSVQGTCKYGTRVDYILSSPNSPYTFVPASYSVFSSKGTSDHHIVKVDLQLLNYPHRHTTDHHHHHYDNKDDDDDEVHHDKMMRSKQQQPAQAYHVTTATYNNTSSSSSSSKLMRSFFKRKCTHNHPIYIV